MSDDNEEEWRDCIELEERTLTFGTFTFSILQMEELPLAASLFMLEEMSRTQSEISGQRIWAGSHLMAMYLIQNPKIVKDQSILELGAGIGCCSLVCSRIGVSRLLSSDGDKAVVQLLETNLKRNKCDGNSTCLLYGEVTSFESVEKEFGHDKFQKIVAGDVLYKRELLDPFFTTLHHFLSSEPSSSAYVCHIPRADVGHEVVLECAKKHHFKVQIVVDTFQSEKGYPIECPPEDVLRAKLYCFTRKTS